MHQTLAVVKYTKKTSTRELHLMGKTEDIKQPLNHHPKSGGERCVEGIMDTKNM